MKLQASQDVWENFFFFLKKKNNKWQRNLETLPKCEDGGFLCALGVGCLEGAGSAEGAGETPGAARTPASP